MDKELETAILFEEYLVEGIDDFIFLVPKQVLIGESDEKKLKFYDKLTQKIYYNSDFAIPNGIEESFYYVKDLTKLQREYRDYDFTSLAQKYLKDSRKKVYYFDEDDCMIMSQEDNNDFYKKSGIKDYYGFVDDDDHKFDDNDETILLDDTELLDYTEEVPNIKDAYDQITKNVLCQDKQIKKLLTAIYKNIYFDNEAMKSNILIYGPTGVGKTAMLRQIAKIVGLPMVIEDANRFTINGYKGSDVEEALIDLFYEANGELEEAEYGILVFDEIDKKIMDSDVSEVTSTGVLNSLLKIVEGAQFNIEIAPKQIVQFDTSHLTVIFSGAFSKMNQKLGLNKKSIGFTNEVKTNINNTIDYTAEDFVKFGFNPEFIGRINCFIHLNSLSLGDIKHILVNSESSPLKAYQEAFKQHGIDLYAQDKLIDLIAEKAYKMNTGARGLQAIVNQLFENILFDFFSTEDDLGKIKLTEKALDNNSEGYQLVKKNNQKTLKRF